MLARSLLLVGLCLAGTTSCKPRSYNSDTLGAKGMACDLGGSLALDKNTNINMCQPLVWALSNPVCKRNVNDPYEYGGTLLFGPDVKEGEHNCHDKSQVKPVLALANTDAARFGFCTDLKRADYSTASRALMLGEQFASIKDVVISNIEDIDDQLVVGQIPVNDIQDVFFQIEKFIVGNFTGAHAQLRVVFNKPIKFRKQFPASSSSPIMESNDLILSVNAVRPSKIPYDPIVKGTNDSYANSFGVLTLRERYLDSTLRQKNPTEQWRLSLTPVQAKKLVLSFFGWSEYFENRRVYHTAFQSCGTEQFFNFDSVLGPEFGKRKPEAITSRLPNTSALSYKTDNRTWDAPVFYELNSDFVRIASMIVQQGAGDAVADLFPLYAANGLWGSQGPLRDRNLVGPGDSSKVENVNELNPSAESVARVAKQERGSEKQKLRVQSVQKVHAELCAMAKSHLAASLPDSWNAMIWEKALKNCETP